MSERQRTGEAVEFVPINKQAAPTDTASTRQLAEQAAVDRVQRREKRRAKLPRVRPCETAGLAFEHPVGDGLALSAVLRDTFATGDLTFTGALLDQFTSLSKVDETYDPGRMKSLLACVRAVAPRDETEALLAVQMAAIHDATLRVAATLAKSTQLGAYDITSNAMNKLARTFTVQLDSLKRYRTTEQSIRVHHTYAGGGDKKRRVTS